MSYHETEGLAFILLFVALLIVSYAVKHNNAVRAMFSCKFFNISLETEKVPPKNRQS